VLGLWVYECFLHSLKRSAQVRDRYRAADDQRHVEGIEEFFTLDPLLDALKNVIGDAVVAPEYQRCYKPEQFLGPGIECTGFIGQMIEREKPFYAEMTAGQNALVHLCTVFVEFVVSHEPSQWCGTYLVRI